MSFFKDYVRVAKKVRLPHVPENPTDPALKLILRHLMQPHVPWRGLDVSGALTWRGRAPGTRVVYLIYYGEVLRRSLHVTWYPDGSYAAHF